MLERFRRVMADERGFIHKKIFGGIKGAVGGFLGGGPLGAVKGGISGFGSGGRQAPILVGGRGGAPPFPGALTLEQMRDFQAKGACETGYNVDYKGNCVKAPVAGGPQEGYLPLLQRIVPFGETGRYEFGEATMGRYGAGLVPAVRSSQTRICPRGAVLGNDGICYNRRDIRNKERQWPRGRRPLLTGGEMRAISVASAAAKKLQAKQKQLQELGLMKKPAARPRPKALAPGHHAHVAHD